MTNFHYTLRNKFDDYVKAGGTLTAAHYVLREALRRANMSGRQFRDVEDLVTFCLGFNRQANAEAIRKAA